MTLMAQVTQKQCTELSIHKPFTKASDVQHTNEVSRRVEGEALVDPGDHMIKQMAVDGFS